MSFAERCGIHDAAREAALLDLARQIEHSQLELVRIAWCDPHGVLRGKTLVASAAARALRDGVGLVSTLMLKDTSDRTAFKVFDTVAVMTRGGPMGSSEVLLYVTYLEGFQYFHMGYAAALTLIFLAFILVFSIAQTVVLDRRVHY